MEVKTEIMFDSIKDDFSGSLCRRRYVEIDGKREYLGEPHRLAIVPGDVESARKFISDGYQQEAPGIRMAALRTMVKDCAVMKFLNTFWTPEHIQMYQNLKTAPDEHSEGGKCSSEKILIEGSETL